MKTLGKVGIIGRFRPIQIGTGMVLENLCHNSDYVIIGIGSSNKYNARNPFTAEETKGMIDALLKDNFDNYKVIFIPDFGHDERYRDGQKWREYVVEHFGQLDAFITGNDYVAKLLENDYRIIPSIDFVPREKRNGIRGESVRIAMAEGGDWRHMVPKQVAYSLEKNGLVDRFKKEFGLETLAGLCSSDHPVHDEITAERKLTYQT